MNDDEPRKQMAYLLRNYSMGDMARNWMYLFSEVSVAYLDIHVFECLPFYFCSSIFHIIFLITSRKKSKTLSFRNIVEHLKHYQYI